MHNQKFAKHSNAYQVINYKCYNDTKMISWTYGHGKIITGLCKGTALNTWQK